MVKPSVDILYSALRKARKISPTKGMSYVVYFSMSILKQIKTDFWFMGPGARYDI